MEEQITRIEVPTEDLPSFEEAKNYILAKGWFIDRDIKDIFYGYEGNDNTSEMVVITQKNNNLTAGVWYENGKIYGEY